MAPLRRLRPEEVTTMFSDELTAWMTVMPADELARRLTGGITVSELPDDMASVISRAMRPTDFVIAPLPNQLFMRDTSAWIYGGVSINHMYWPARQHETLNLEAVYRFHPRFRDAKLRSGSEASTTTGAAHRSRAATSCRSGTASCSSVRASEATHARSASSPPTSSQPMQRAS